MKCKFCNLDSLSPNFAISERDGIPLYYRNNADGTVDVFCSPYHATAQHLADQGKEIPDWIKTPKNNT